MADIDRVIAVLDKVKKTGENKWLACCPAHNDKSPSLAIKCIDGKILIHCFGGCSAQEIVESIGLTLADLMPDRPDYKKGSKPPKFNKYELFDRAFFESLILYTAIKQIFNNKPLSNTDRQRVEQAMEIIFDIKREVSR
ncbi:MAG: CHC2 zinc finger domain-containing protein [Methylococcales bacterium]